MVTAVVLRTPGPHRHIDAVESFIDVGADREVLRAGPSSTAGVIVEHAAAMTSRAAAATHPGGRGDRDEAILSDGLEQAQGQGLGNSA